MRYVLRTNKGETGFEEISEDYYNELNESYCCILNAYHIEEKFDLVVSNYLEFETSVYETLLNHMVGRYPGWVNFLEVQLNINRRLANLLSACKTYFDQVYRHMILCFKGDRSTAKSLKTYASAIYDSEINYRIMEALRNHVQHHSLAVHRSRVGGRRVSPETEDSKVEYGVGFVVDREELSKNKKFKPDVLREMPERVDIVTAVRTYINCMNFIQLRARALVDSRIQSSNRTLLDAAGGTRESFGYLQPVAMSIKGPGEHEGTVLLDGAHYDELMKLRMKNPARSKFENGYFTGTPLS